MAVYSCTAQLARATGIIPARVNIHTTAVSLDGVCVPGTAFGDARYTAVLQYTLASSTASSTAADALDPHCGEARAQQAQAVVGEVAECHHVRW